MKQLNFIYLFEGTIAIAIVYAIMEDCWKSQ